MVKDICFLEASWKSILHEIQKWETLLLAPYPYVAAYNIKIKILKQSFKPVLAQKITQADDGLLLSSTQLIELTAAHAYTPQQD